MKKNVFTILFLVFLCLPSISFLFHPGFFQSDDGEWMIIRFSAFYQALSDGQFPVRFLGRLNHEFGYPVANFLYPGFMYLGVPIHFLGFGFVDTIKIIFGASMISSAVFCFLWLLRFFDRFSSFIGALFYLYTPYHLFDLYKRGSVGEVLALAIFPFILWQIERKSLFWSSIGIAALILSHNTLAILFLPIVFIYVLFLAATSEEPKSLLRHLRGGTESLLGGGILMMFLGLGLSTFFWIPAIFELQYTVFFQTQVSEWNNYFSEVGLIGVPTFLVLFITIVLFFSSKVQINKHRLTLLFLVVGLLSVFFASSSSSILWNVLPVSFIQFPFRFLSITIICVAFLSAFVVYILPKNVKVPLGIILLVILLMSAYPFLIPSEFFDKGEGFYATNMGTTTVQNEYMPKWVKEIPTSRFEEKVEIVEGVRKVENASYNSKRIAFNVSSEQDTRVRVNTIYYPGWNAMVYPSRCHPELVSGSPCDGEELTINYQNNKGVMELVVPRGQNKIELKFSETPLRLFANMTSIASIILLLFYTKWKQGNTTLNWLNLKYPI